MDDSPLAKLPAEIKNDIYERVLALEKAVQLQYNCQSHCGFIRRHRLPLNTLALAFTCKEIRRDCLSVFYAINSFDMLHEFEPNIFVPNEVIDPIALDWGVYNENFGNALQAWVISISQRNARQLRNVQIYVGGESSYRFTRFYSQAMESLAIAKMLAPLVRFFKSSGANFTARVWPTYAPFWMKCGEVAILQLPLCDPDRMIEMIDTAEEIELADLETCIPAQRQVFGEYLENIVQDGMDNLRHFAELFRLQNRKASDINFGTDISERVFDVRVQRWTRDDLDKI